MKQEKRRKVISDVPEMNASVPDKEESAKETRAKSRFFSLSFAPNRCNVWFLRTLSPTRAMAKARQLTQSRNITSNRRLPDF
jgi:hypothetical protein